MKRFNELSKLQKFGVIMLIVFLLFSALYTLGISKRGPRMLSNKDWGFTSGSDVGVTEDYSEAPMEPGYMPSPMPQYGNGNQGSDGGGYQDENKVISTYRLKIETKEFDETVESIENLANDSKGYISSRNVDTVTKPNGQIAKVGYLTLKIPSDKADFVVKTIKEGLFVIKENSDTVDVTTRYSDLEATIKSLQSQENKLNQLMERALNIEDIITIDNRLSEVIREKEMLTRQLLGLKERVSYTTVSVDVEEVKEYTMLETAQDSTSRRIANAFVNSFKNSVIVFEEIIIFVVSLTPFILLGGALVFVYNKVVKKKRYNSKNEK